MKNEFIVFAYWKDGILQGFRADTFGTISDKHPKIYGYSEKQVNVVLENTKAACNNAGTALMKSLTNKNITVTNGEQEMEPSSLVTHVSKTEQKLREWKSFELKVHPFIGYDENFCYPEQWKVEAEINNLKDPIESHTFNILANEN